MRCFVSHCKIIHGISIPWPFFQCPSRHPALPCTASHRACVDAMNNHIRPSVSQDFSSQLKPYGHDQSEQCSSHPTQSNSTQHMSQHAQDSIKHECRNPGTQPASQSAAHPASYPPNQSGKYVTHDPTNEIDCVQQHPHSI